jgi:hypothetical protein
MEGKFYLIDGINVYGDIVSLGSDTNLNHRVMYLIFA